MKKKKQRNKKKTLVKNEQIAEWNKKNKRGENGKEECKGNKFTKEKKELSKKGIKWNLKMKTKTK